MSTQNKMSIKQVIRQEYKLIGLISIIVILLPFISEAIFVSDLIQFKGLSIIDKLGVLLNKSDFTFTNASILLYVGMLITGICVPVFAAIIAHKLKGETLLQSIVEGINNIATKRFWKFIGLVYVPFGAIMLAIYIGLRFIPETFTLNVLSNLLSSNLAMVIAVILLIVISVIVTSIAGMIFVANVVYHRDGSGIKQSFKAIPSRESNKLIIFNATEAVVGVLIVLGFVVPLMLQGPLSFLSNIISYMIALMVSLMIYQVIFIFMRFSLYINISSKSELVVPTAIEVNNQTTNEVVVEQAVELSVKPKGSNRIKNNQVDNPFELSIKPKRSSKKNINPDLSNKPKR